MQPLGSWQHFCPQKRPRLFLPRSYFWVGGALPGRRGKESLASFLTQAGCCGQPRTHLFTTQFHMELRFPFPVLTTLQ